MANALQSDLSSQLQYAFYLPAISPGYGEMAIKSAASVRPMPAGLVPADLNFLDPQSRLFYLPAALYSAGHVPNLSNPPPSMVTQRPPKSSFILADSGGYQIISGKLAAPHTWQRKQIYDWQQQYADYGMTLDVPTKALDNTNSGYSTFGQCLSDTLAHLADYEYFYNGGTGAKRVSLLNVLQGRDPHEADIWYDAVKAYSFDGWAFAGPTKEDLYQVIRRILVMLDEGRLNSRENWLHFLGLGKFKFAVLLTALRNGIRYRLNDPNFHVSLDTSSAGIAAMKYRRVFTTTNFTSKSFGLNTALINFNSANHLGSSQPFPYPNSPIGQVLTMGDLIVKPGTHMNSRMDMLSACMLANHNYYVYCRGILEANQELEKHAALTLQTVPTAIRNAWDVIADIFAANDPKLELAKRRIYLDRI